MVHAGQNIQDKIYRNRTNLQFCKEHGICLSGLALGRPRKNAKTDKKTEYADNADQIAMNVDRIYRSLLRLLFDIVLSRFKQHNFMPIFIQTLTKRLWWVVEHSLAIQYKIQWLFCTFGSCLRGKYLKKSLKINDLGLDIIGRIRVIINFLIIIQKF